MINIKSAIPFTFLLVFNLLSGAEIDLNEVWKLTLKNNENVKIFNLNNYQADLLQKQVVSQYLPEVRGRASLAYSKKETDPGTFPVVPNFLKTGKVIVSQTIYDGRLFSASSSTKFNVKATKERSDFQTTELLFLASAAYLQVLQNEQLVVVSNKQLDLAHQLENVAKQRYEAGEVPKTDLLRASLEVSRSKREKFSLENTLKLSREELSNIVGIDLSEYVLTEPQFLNSDLNQSMDQLVEIAEKNRKDIRSLESRVQSRWYELQGARRGNWPRLFANAEYSLVDPDTLIARNNFWTGVLTLEIPIFDRWENTLLVQKISAQLSQDQLELDRVRKDVEVQVADAWLNVSTSKENLSILQQEAEIEAENYSMLNERYQQGQATNIDLTDAFQNLISIEASRANEAFNLMLSFLRLYKDIGMFDVDNLCDSCFLIKGIQL